MLREELGFEGLVISEGGGFSTLTYEKIVATQKEAGALDIMVGESSQDIRLKGSVQVVN